MKFPRLSYNRVARVLLFTAPLWMSPITGAAHGVEFRKPGSSSAPAVNSSLQFRSASAPAESEAPPAPAKAKAAPAPAAPVTAPTVQQVAKPLASAARPLPAPAVAQAPARITARPAFTQPESNGVETAAYTTVDRSRMRNFAALDYDESLLGPPIHHQRESFTAPAGYCADCNSDPGCGLQEATCGCGEANCGICEPGCGAVEPGCGTIEANCGAIEAGCGLEPGCGMQECVDCGSGVNRGSDYWCFPVCLPRFRDLSVWAGVHGFKGPRDSPLFGGSGDGNFGFQEGINIGGKAPLIGLLFPELSYQLGYQAVQSHLSGTTGGVTDDRAQDFVTIGFFRRVPAGLQFGAAWDYMADDWLVDANFQQIRYEISLKTQRGREFGFLGSTHTNSSTIGEVNFQAVDQYRFFFRNNFKAGDMRFWVGFSNDSETIFGGDFYVPFSDRWSLQTGFNYLIPSGDAGLIGATEEAWNIGMNLVWHFGGAAQNTRNNPHRPMFNIADNGSMFIDQSP
ncbi:DUF6666 family protein [Lacipirellula parvula]|uniref:Uncharacterized protein n=1 Tax=Lacipirellula parvula TaxID=2650471 RepID=A0A5K7XD86_9BACT|nr:DUF6666 family protein [Lacipirellula parvula]BBO32356.1 hypothetical protein PLANPX_1968 [Lacipirellula parvula]